MCLSPLIQFSIDEGIKGSLSSNKIKPYRFEEKTRKTGVTNDKNTRLLDIGAYPGGWSQVSSKIITVGKILSLDIKKMDQLKGVSFLQCDFLEKNTKEKIFNFFKGKLDVVLSDMAANTTGNKALDCIRTNELCANVVEFASNILKPKGVLVSKLFMG